MHLTWTLITALPWRLVIRRGFLHQTLGKASNLELFMCCAAMGWQLPFLAEDMLHACRYRLMKLPRRQVSGRGCQPCLFLAASTRTTELNCTDVSKTYRSLACEYDANGNQTSRTQNGVNPEPHV